MLCKAVQQSLITRPLKLLPGQDGNPVLIREALVVQQLPLSLNPLIAADDPAVHDVGHLLYRSLLRLDATDYPRPDLAQSYTVSSDGLTYRIVLAPNQRWSDGSAITPADVAATTSSRPVPRARCHRCLSRG